MNKTRWQIYLNGLLLLLPWTPLCILQTINVLFCYKLYVFKCLKPKINIMWLKTLNSCDMTSVELIRLWLSASHSAMLAQHRDVLSAIAMDDDIVYRLNPNNFCNKCNYIDHCSC